MRRENKLALIVGFSVLLVVAVLVSDHLSASRQRDVVDGLDSLLEVPGGKSFIETPLRTAPPLGGSMAHRDAITGERSRDATPPAGRTVEPARPETQIARENAAGPIEMEMGSSVEPRAGGVIAGSRQTRGMSDITGIDSETIRRWFDEQPALAQRGSSQSQEATDHESSDVGRDTDVAPTPSIQGYIPRDNKYVIQKNDTLFEISERFYGTGSRWRELVAINKDKIREDGTVFPGVTIDLLPGVRHASPRPQRRVESPPAASRPSVSSGSTTSYTVRKGDTLSEIVQREVGSIRFLARVREMNPWLVKQKDNIRVGQTLTLPAMRHASVRAR